MKIYNNMSEGKRGLTYMPDDESEMLDVYAFNREAVEIQTIKKGLLVRFHISPADLARFLKDNYPEVVKEQSDET
jgi:hypothetical protein